MRIGFHEASRVWGRRHLKLSTAQRGRRPKQACRSGCRTVQGDMQFRYGSVASMGPFLTTGEFSQEAVHQLLPGISTKICGIGRQPSVSQPELCSENSFNSS